jgi:hypothetical protein
VRRHAEGDNFPLLAELVEIGCQAEKLMRNKITHVTKTEFLPCFIAAYKASITKSNILGGFRGIAWGLRLPGTVLDGG